MSTPDTTPIVAERWAVYNQKRCARNLRIAKAALARIENDPMFAKLAEQRRAEITIAKQEYKAAQVELKRARAAVAASN